MCVYVWCGVVWCGVVWCGVMWCGVVWCGVVWCVVYRVCGACVHARPRVRATFAHRKYGPSGLGTSDLWTVEPMGCLTCDINPSDRVIVIFIRQCNPYTMQGKYNAK